MTVKEGQAWVSDYVKNQAKKKGLEVRTYWRTPENGVDWKLEINSEANSKSVFATIWFLHLKTLDQAVKKKLKGDVDEALRRLLNEVSQVA